MAKQVLTLILVVFFICAGNAQKRKGDIRNVKQDDVFKGVSNGLDSLKTEFEFISSLNENDIRVAVGSSSAAHFQFFQTTPTAMKLGEEALKVISASRRIKEELKLSPEEAVSSLPLISVSGTLISAVCQAKPTCTSSKYRTADGSCNNPKNPLWGRSLTPMQRILDAIYADGIFDPRVGVDGKPLPSARLVSSSLVPDLDKPNNDLALMFMTFGQFTDHDFNLAPIFTTANGSGIECCTTSGDFLPASKRHPRCLPIEIPENDPFYGPLKRRCMNFVRTIPGPRPDCTFGYAEQLEELTHWMDASQVYGSDDTMTRRLRSFSGGKLLTGNVGGPNSLPLDPKDKDCETCFIAGDVRVTENQLLTEMHTVWFREHNRVATELARLNPSWNDETLFQESRRIVIAELQHVTYNEYLPITLGPAYIKTYNLFTTDNLSSDYDSNINPSINNEFATAAFRMGHTLLQGIVRIFSSERSVDSTPTLSSIIQNSAPYSRRGFLDRVTLSLLNQPIQNFDKAVTKEVTTRLFRGDLPFGMDLVALNLQRGREHGLPGYNEYREICGLPKANTFEELAPLIPSETIGIFKRVYRHVDDIDLFVGGIYEAPVPGALVGRTFSCIIGDQFTRLKKADRFFYDLGGQPHSFRQDQLAQIRKITLARILCDNQDGAIQSVQLSAFRIASPQNPKVACSDSLKLPRVDLSLWAGERTF